MAELENQVAKEAATEETAKATEKAAPKKTAAKKAATPKAEVSKGASSKEINRVHAKYKNEVIDQLVKQFGYKNINQVPKLVKITINTGFGDVKDNPKSVQTAIAELTLIAGQKPITTTAKKSIANFKVRQNMMVGAKVDLRNERMYEFFDKLVSIALPRVRDFKGVPTKSFDGRGNYALGVKEQLIFPEISYESVEKIRGFDICFVTTAKTDDEARALLTMLGMPFAK